MAEENRRAGALSCVTLRATTRNRFLHQPVIHREGLGTNDDGRYIQSEIEAVHRLVETRKEPDDGKTIRGFPLLADIDAIDGLGRRNVAIGECGRFHARELWTRIGRTTGLPESEKRGWQTASA